MLMLAVADALRASPLMYALLSVLNHLAVCAGCAVMTAALFRVQPRRNALYILSAALLAAAVGAARPALLNSGDINNMIGSGLLFLLPFLCSLLIFPAGYFKKAAITAFCYTAMTTVKDRLLWGPIIPEHPDMELMMETILVNAEPLMVFIMTYFVVQFSFSQVAQKLGSQCWFRSIVAVPCVYMFFASFFRMITRMIILIDSIRFVSLEWFIVQPITVYLVIFISRLIKERRKDKEERRDWKELAKI